MLYGLKQLAKRGYAGGFDLAQRSVWDVLDNLEYPEPLTVEQSSSSLLQCVQGVEPLFSYGDGVWLMKEVAGRRSKKRSMHYNYLIRDGLTTTVRSLTLNIMLVHRVRVVTVYTICCGHPLSICSK